LDEQSKWNASSYKYKDQKNFPIHFLPLKKESLDQLNVNPDSFEDVEFDSQKLVLEIVGRVLIGI
jgi:hypothetical protein